MIILELSLDNPKLARAEAENICGKGKLIGKYLIVHGGQYHKLAYTNFALKHILICRKSDLSGINVMWSDYITGSYAVLGPHAKSVRTLAKVIWKKLPNPIVSLKNPDSTIVIIEHKNTVIIGRLLWRNTKSYMDRRAHKRPAPHPTSMHPKLARACINLLGPKVNTILDPFCGTGGILIEAGYLGIRSVGYDINNKMLVMAKKNIAHYNINAKLLKRDALDLDKRYKYIVTDLPYGKNTQNIDSSLYKKFLERLRVKRAVIVFPNKVPKMPKNLKIEKRFSIYVHKSLKKKIIVLRNS